MTSVVKNFNIATHVIHQLNLVTIATLSQSPITIIHHHKVSCIFLFNKGLFLQETTGPVNMMGIKAQRCANMCLVRSRSSMKSLSGHGSEASLTSVSTTRNSPDRLRKTSSSFYLHSSSISTVSFQSESSGTKETNIICPTSDNTAKTTPSSRSDANQRTLVQCAVLIAMAFHMPSNLLDEIVEILELHIHTFPLLVVLGTLPGWMMRASRRSTNTTAESTTPRSRATASTTTDVGGMTSLESGYHSNKSMSSSCTLQNIQDYYAAFENERPASDLVAHKNLPTNASDEWGHFADFDDTSFDHILYTSKSSSDLTHSVSGRSLAPLHETEEEHEW